MVKDNNKKDELELYRLKNCMWCTLSLQSFHFECSLRNIYINDPKLAVNWCQKCLLFKDTNEEIDGGYLQ